MTYKLSRARSLALEMDAFGLIGNCGVDNAEAVISDILFCFPELSDDKVCAKATQYAQLFNIAF